LLFCSSSVSSFGAIGSYPKTEINQRPNQAYNGYPSDHWSPEHFARSIVARDHRNIRVVVTPTTIESQKAAAFGGRVGTVQSH
jgi:hypothetical protein